MSDTLTRLGPYLSAAAVFGTVTVAGAVRAWWEWAHG